MGSVQVEFLSLFQVLAGVKTATVEIDGQISVEELLCCLSNRYKGVAAFLGDCSQTSIFNNKVTVLVNGLQVTSLADYIIPGDRVILLVPLCGG